MIYESNVVLVEHKDWLKHEGCQRIFIKMKTDNLVGGDPLPPVTVKYDAETSRKFFIRAKVK